MRASTVRSANSTMLLWAGAVGVLFGGFTGLYGLAMALQTRYLAAVASLLMGAVIVLAACALLAMGWRTSARVDPAGVSWAKGFGSRAQVPWEQIARVLVPDEHEAGDTVALLLHDGRIVPVTSLRKLQPSDFGTGISPRYQRAGAILQSAHQQWLGSRQLP